MATCSRGCSLLTILTLFLLFIVGSDAKAQNPPAPDVLYVTSGYMGVYSSPSGYGIWNRWNIDPRNPNSPAGWTYNVPFASSITGFIQYTGTIQGNNLHINEQMDVTQAFDHTVSWVYGVGRYFETPMSVSGAYVRGYPASYTVTRSISGAMAAYVTGNGAAAAQFDLNGATPWKVTNNNGLSFSDGPTVQTGVTNSGPYTFSQYPGVKYSWINFNDYFRPVISGSGFDTSVTHSTLQTDIDYTVTLSQSLIQIDTSGFDFSQPTGMNPPDNMNVTWINHQRTKRFIIKNVGKAPLIGTVSIKGQKKKNGQPDQSFSITSSGSNQSLYLSLLPNQSRRVDVAFTPGKTYDDVGTHTLTLEIVSNASNLPKGTKDFDITAEARGPYPIFHHHSFEPQESTRKDALTVRNWFASSSGCPEDIDTSVYYNEHVMRLIDNITAAISPPWSVKYLNYSPRIDNFWTPVVSVYPGGRVIMTDGADRYLTFLDVYAPDRTYLNTYVTKDVTSNIYTFIGLDTHNQYSYTDTQHYQWTAPWLKDYPDGPLSEKTAYEFQPAGYTDVITADGFGVSGANILLRNIFYDYGLSSWIQVISTNNLTDIWKTSAFPPELYDD